MYTLLQGIRPSTTTTSTGYIVSTNTKRVRPQTLPESHLQRGNLWRNVEYFRMQRSLVYLFLLLPPSHAHESMKTQLCECVMSAQALS